MNHERALLLLNQHREEILHRFAVPHLALFGSTARDAARPDSDLDVLGEFEGQPTVDGHMGLVSYLEQLFGQRVDLVTATGFKPRARHYVEKNLYVSRDWLLYLDDIIEAAEKIGRFVAHQRQG